MSGRRRRGLVVRGSRRGAGPHAARLRQAGLRQPPRRRNLAAVAADRFAQGLGSRRFQAEPQLAGGTPHQLQQALAIPDRRQHEALLLGHLPQGQPERDRRVLGMVRQMDAEGFGNCTNHYECEAVCPKEISADVISKLNRDYAAAIVREAVAE